MTDDAAFLAAIRAAPDDNTPRLVYADWLDDRDRPGGDFLRLECEIAHIDRDDEAAWWQLFLRLKKAARGLDEGWIGAVGRIQPPELFAREREIASWLRRRMTVEELLAPQPGLSVIAPGKGLWSRVRRWFTRTTDEPVVTPEPRPPVRSLLDDWVEGNMQPGDELWEYDTGGESWAHLCGERGYAIVRNGKVVEFWMAMMN